MIAIVQLLKEPPSDACAGREDSDLPCALKHGKHGTDRVRMIASSQNTIIDLSCDKIRRERQAQGEVTEECHFNTTKQYIHTCPASHTTLNVGHRVKK